MRPLDLGETLDAAFTICRSRWRTLVVVMAAVAIPVELASFLVAALTRDGHRTGNGLLTGTGYAGGAGALGAVVVATLAIVGYLLGTVACYRAVTDTYLGRDTSAEASLRFARQRLSPALWLMILLVLGLVAGFLACVVPGVWLSVAWSVAMPVLLVEGRTGTAALSRSMALVRDRWWATFGRLAVAWILLLVISGVISAVLTAPVAGSDSLGALAVQHVVGAISSIITTPFVAAVTALVYFDLRARKEDFDPRAPRPAGGEPAPDGAPGGWLPPVPPDGERP